MVITIHKALDIEKKGMVGKADPYIVLQVLALFASLESLICIFTLSTMTKSR